MKILITGGCGFVGSNLALSLIKEFPDSEIIAFDNLKRRGSELNIKRLKAAGIRFVHGDIRNEEDLDALSKLDIVIDASAEPSVLAGIEGGHKQLININLNGTINILNLALKNKSAFIFLSTSRVYPIEHINEIIVEEEETRFTISDRQNFSGISADGISEEFSLEGYRSIYGASKLASELMIHEYTHFFGLRSIINRCGVIAGPYQMGKVDQGVTVLWLAKHFWKKELGYFGYGGTGKQVRDILHVDDLCDLIKLQIRDISLFNGKVFNVGGGLESSLSLQELTVLCQNITGNTIPIKSVTNDRIADIRLYITDNARITNICGWKPQRTPKDIVTDIYKWLVENENDLTDILS